MVSRGFFDPQAYFISAYFLFAADNCSSILELLCIHVNSNPVTFCSLITTPFLRPPGHCIWGLRVFPSVIHDVDHFSLGHHIPPPKPFTWCSFYLLYGVFRWRRGMRINRIATTNGPTLPNWLLDEEVDFLRLVIRRDTKPGLEWT